jgi:hypothetical protein
MHDQGVRAIAIFVFKRGGVGGAVRRLVYGQKSIFTSVGIHGAFYRKYPHIEPAPFQIQDCLDALEKWRAIECLPCNSISKIYLRPKRMRQMKLKLRFNLKPKYDTKKIQRTK